mmetsp:Transcript_42347/g.64975  ORF Transcript_42347/g.64975 Transcript_42347/m.64975 type:complete len:235 (+) Transcript_42347:945-1649(+)|eukprot:CAMPEP_0170503722 /NCGR_PEP_ID=MMETSP0208-20121228/45692_1 /TAXON_ID=197538 /ORGANISM="Strombidium inclinatum, Strain S3" /LENGTH=234 /DNA_ID=CAMNT_0010783517 /DNA_START=876 /DNA_END=1580 /DNA_ORIENTATION=+
MVQLEEEVVEEGPGDSCLVQTDLEKIIHRKTGPKKKGQVKKAEPANKKKYGEKSEDFSSAVAQAQKWMLKYKSPDEIPDSSIPLEYDYRNLSGYDFTGPVRDQEECGSCYTLGFIQAVEARLKLKYAGRAQIPQLSPQFLMECNYMNEGCDGGWAIFHGFLAENGHMITEECGPYKAKTKGESCANYKNCPGFAKVRTSYYVGGYNFSPTVKDIQKELLMKGPLVTEFKCNDAF